MSDQELIRWMDRHPVVSTLGVACIYALCFAGWCVFIAVLAFVAASCGEVAR